jgi:hypothetical protein
MYESQAGLLPDATRLFYFSMNKHTQFSASRCVPDTYSTKYIMDRILILFSLLTPGFAEHKQIPYLLPAALIFLKTRYLWRSTWRCASQLILISALNTGVYCMLIVLMPLRPILSAWMHATCMQDLISRVWVIRVLFSIDSI